MNKLHSSLTLVLKALSTLRKRGVETIRRWWNNPLLNHARRLAPIKSNRIQIGTLIGAACITLLAGLAWVLNWRLVGAALMALSLGVVLLPVIISPIMSADRIVRQMQYAKQDPRRLRDLKPVDVAWGLSLVTLWKLRWLILAGVLLTPALMLSVLRIDLADYHAWQESAAVLGTTTPGGRVIGLLPGGRIPLFRLVIRAVSAGLLPWTLMPLMSSGGVTSALRLNDITLSPLAALIGGGAGLVVVGIIWELLSKTNLFGQSFEVLRLLLLIVVGGGLAALTDRVNRYNAQLLISIE